jgi:preprotein translocase subunit YajC
MRSKLGAIACGVVAALATAACAVHTDPVTPAGAQNYPAGPGPQTYVATAGDITGTVVRVDPASNVVMMDDGRMYQVAGDSTVFIDNQPARVTTVRPGSRVVLRSARPVASRDGQYVVVQQHGPGGTTVTTMPPYSGTVVRIDEGQRVLVFDDGRMWQTAGDSMVIVDGQPRVIGTVQPGARVTVHQGYPVEYRDGRYVQVMPPAAPGLRQTIWGRVIDVDRDEIEIKTDDGGSFEVRVPAHMAPSIRKGDTVQLDLTIPAGSPSGAPRPR